LFNEEILPNLKEFLFCGEVLTNVTVSKLHERFPQSVVVNTYGPTESTCAITDVTVTKNINKKIMPLPVGKAKKGTWINIIDENGNILGDGEKGEIIIIGDSVSVGYFNNKELTDKKFGITSINNHEYRFYRTGDEGYLKKKMLYYCGRIDLQIKLHGYRIEIEDIENNLMKVKDVVQVAVVPKYKDGKVNSLVAFVVYNSENCDFETGMKIKNELKKFVPEYMVPKKIVFMDSLPRTNNGKIDRKKLGEQL
jgi:D-alanine--poly(phosphoribitol) ligase subunit 1